VHSLQTSSDHAVGAVTLALSSGLASESPYWMRIDDRWRDLEALRCTASCSMA
jgi:hypothetical protein